MNIDGKSILKRLEASRKRERKKVSLYLAQDLHERFMEACGDIPMSKVMEALMNEFIESLKKTKAKS